MTDGRTAFLWRGGIGRSFGGTRILGRILFLRGKLVLPFEVQFQFDLLKFLFQPFIFFYQSAESHPVRNNRTTKWVQRLQSQIGHKCTDCGTAQVGTMAHVRTTLFELRVKAKLHRLPFQFRNCSRSNQNSRTPQPVSQTFTLPPLSLILAPSLRVLRNSKVAALEACTPLIRCHSPS